MTACWNKKTMKKGTTPASVRYVVANDDTPQKVWAGSVPPDGSPTADFSAVYTDATEFESLAAAKRIAERLAKKVHRSLEVIANFGLENENRVYIAYRNL
jgi:hypothetical protein